MQLHHILTTLLLTLLPLTHGCVTVDGIYCTSASSSSGTILNLNLYDNAVLRCHLRGTFYDEHEPELFLACDRGDTAFIRRSGTTGAWMMAYLPAGAAHDFRFPVWVGITYGGRLCEQQVTLRAEQYGPCVDAYKDNRG